MLELPSMVTVTQAPFITMPTRTIVGMRSKPQTLRGTDLVHMHTEMPRKVNKIFVGHPSNPTGGGSRPPRPSRYFGLPMMDPNRPPLPPNKPYH